jgi:hypothetical protein
MKAMKRSGKAAKVASRTTGIFVEMRRIIFSLLLLGVAAQANTDLGFVTNASFDSGPLRVTLLNYEVPRNKPYLIAHFEIRNPSDQDQICDWKSLVYLLRPDGTTMTSNYDVLVDSGTGGTRATGPFLVARGRKARASVLFVLNPGDLPGHLVLPDGRRSARIDFRGKARWNQ